MVLTVAVTVICGFYTGRWQGEQQSIAAAQRLQALPTTIGDWVMSEEISLGKSEVTMLEIAGRYLCRRYRHRQTQEEVNLVILVGPSGKMIVHTPEVCFGGLNYVCDTGRLRVAFETRSGKETERADDTFWKVIFRDQRPQGGSVVFYYALSGGAGWIASDNPRGEFRGQRFIYKIQVESMTPRKQKLEDDDTVARFLDDALPMLDDMMSGNDTVSEHDTMRGEVQ